MPAPAEAICQETIWKNPELLWFAVSLVTEALKVHPAHFSTDIVPDTQRGSGQGMAGSVVTMLQNASLIEPVGITSGGKFYPDRVKSVRDTAKSRYVNLYRLSNPALAREFLNRNKA